MSPENANKLKRLADEAYALHQQIEKSWQTTLDTAREAGDKLLEARKLLKRKKIGKWLESHFPKWSRETAYAYMRIAKEWDSYKLTTARNKGVQFKSIRSVMKALRTTKQKKLIEDEIKYKVIGEVINKISPYLWTLEIRELKLLLDMDNVWTKTVDRKVKEYDRDENQLLYDLDQEIMQMAQWVHEGDASKKELSCLERQRKIVFEHANRVREGLYT